MILAGKRNKILLCIIAIVMVICTIFSVVHPTVAYAAENVISYDKTNVLDDLKSSTVNGEPFDIKGELYYQVQHLTKK